MMAGVPSFLRPFVFSPVVILYYLQFRSQTLFLFCQAKMRKSLSSNFHPAGGVRLPMLIVMAIILISERLSAAGPTEFNSDAGRNEIVQKRPSEGHAKNSPTKSASSVDPPNWEGSGANPDDEDGDVDEEGSGADEPPAEGSGSPPDEFERRKQNEAITDPRLPAQFGANGKQQYANTTTTVTDLQTTTTTTTVMLATTLRPPLMKPLTEAPTTTALSNSLPRTAPTTTLPRMVKPIHEGKWPPSRSTSPPFAPTRTSKRPFFIADDPSGTLEQLRPGIFAFMVGGVVVGLLLLILIISYLVYRLKKRDEGTYICEEPHQQAHYPYAYQKASIREFYA
uniref:Syndecan/Neurexin domain-containing protein n=1 Tax=Globodera rostochiensis TaxID=31243 RepID=A0A914I2T1_GLORO